MSTPQPHYRTIKELLQSRSFAIDEFQREYKWTKSNIDELLDDLLNKFLSSYTAGDKTTEVASYEDYFLGSIIVGNRNGKSFLIDGQQRVTSLTLLLIHLYRLARKKGLPVEGTLAPLIFSDNLGQPRFNLDIEERLPVIEALFRGEPYSGDDRDESIRNMLDRYRDIEERDLEGEAGEGLPHFMYWLITKVGLIEIATDNAIFAQEIFETMNDRGKPLSPVDMVKAFMLAPVDDPDHRRNLNNKWKQTVVDLISWGGEHEPERDATFIKAWLRAQHADSIRERKAKSTDRDWELIGSTFHRWVRDNRDRLGLGTAEGNIPFVRDHFPFYAKAYQTILGASTKYTPGLEPVFYVAHNDFTWQTTVLLAPLRTTDDPETVRRKLFATATYLDIWIMRRVVNYVRVGYSTTAYAMYKLCQEIRRKPLPELVAKLREKLEQEDDVSFEGSASRGRHGVKDLRLNQFSGRYIFHLLARVTAFVETSSGMPDLFEKYVDRDRKNSFDVEHLWPDDYDLHQDMFTHASEFDAWRNHVAALVLLPADVNRSYQAKPYDDKVKHYTGQNLYAASLNKSAYDHRPQFSRFRTEYALPFKPYDKFGRDEHEERRELLLRLCKLIWSPDRLEEALRP